MEKSGKLKRGDIREDGKVFFGYDKSCHDGEHWTSPEYLAARREDGKIRARGRYYVREERDKRRAYDRRPDVVAKRRAKYEPKPKVIKPIKFNQEYKRAYDLAYKKRRTKEDLEFKLGRNIRTRICSLLKQKDAKNSKTLRDIVGCTLTELKTHIESQFKNGMTWENHGSIGWHVDHIVPLVYADSEEDVIRLSHYTNLQPLWYYDNVRKNPTKKRIQNLRVIDGKVY